MYFKIDVHRLFTFMTKIKSFISFYNLIVKNSLYIYLFGVVSVQIFYYYIYFDPYIFGDSEQYWKLASTFVDNGNFSFDNYPLSIRGYGFPFFLFLIKWFASVLHINQLFFYRIIILFIHALITFFVIPKIFNSIFGLKFSSQYSVFLNFGLLYLFSGLIKFPQTDLLSCYLLLTGIFFLLSKNIFINTISVLPLVFAYYCRPIYIGPFFLFIIYYFYIFYKHNNRKKYLWLISTCIFCYFISLPQIIINFNHYQNKSILIQDSKFFQGGLFVFQLNLGLKNDKYETTLVPKLQGISYPNMGGNMLSCIEKTNEFIYPQQFINLYFSYPFDIISIFYNHLISGLTIQNPEVYIFKSNKSNIILSLFNSCLLSLFLVSLIFIKKLKISSFIIITLLISPSLFCIPMTIEERFFFPLYIFIFSVVGTFSNTFITGLRAKPILYGSIFLILNVYFLAARFNLNVNSSIDPTIYGHF